MGPDQALFTPAYRYTYAICILYTDSFSMLTTLNQKLFCVQLILLLLEIVHWILYTMFSYFAKCFAKQKHVKRETRQTFRETAVCFVYLALAQPGYKPFGENTQGFQIRGYSCTYLVVKRNKTNGPNPSASSFVSKHNQFRNKVIFKKCYSLWRCKVILSILFQHRKSNYWYKWWSLRWTVPQGEEIQQRGAHNRGKLLEKKIIKYNNNIHTVNTVPL
jgi:hypothetical protein